MKLGIYSIFDKKSDVYSNPMFFKKDGEATRTFSDITNDPKTTLYNHPEDYSLYMIGYFNDNSGELIKNPPRHVMNATTVKSIHPPIDLSNMPLDALTKSKNSKVEVTEVK